MTTLEITLEDRIKIIRDELCKKRRKENKDQPDMSYIEGCLDLSTELIKDINRNGI